MTSRVVFTIQKAIIAERYNTIIKSAFIKYLSAITKFFRLFASATSDKKFYSIICLLVSWLFLLFFSFVQASACIVLHHLSCLIFPPNLTNLELKNIYFFAYKQVLCVENYIKNLERIT